MLRCARETLTRALGVRASRSAAPRVAPCCSQHVAPCFHAPRALLQPARHTLLLCASRPTAARASRSASPRVAPCCSPCVLPCCLAHRALLQPARRAVLPCTARALLPAPPRPSRAAQPELRSCHYCCCSCYCCCWWRCCWECWRCRRPASPSRPTATTAAAAARATAAGSAGGAAGAGGAGGAAGSTGGAACARGAGPTTVCHCLSWPLSRQLQQLGVDNSGHCLSRTTSPLSSFRCIPGCVEAAAFGSSESATTLGAHECAVTLRASPSTATGPASAEVLHTFTLESSTSRCFFRDCTTVTPLAAPIPVSLGDPTGGPDEWVDTFILGGQCVAICKCSRTGRHLVTFTRQPRSGLYTLTTASSQVAESGQVDASSQVSASGQLAASCSCRVLSHQTLLWHHHLGHPSFSRLCSMHSRLLVSSLPRSLPSLPRSPAPPCLLCVEGWQRAAPHSSEFPLTTAPLQTLHMDVWGPAPVDGMDQERYFLLIRATRCQLRERFRWDFSVPRLHFDKGGEFSSDLLAEFFRDEGIRQLFTLPASPQPNGIAERRIGLIMEVARTSMIHAATPHFLWSFVVRYAAHQPNLWPRVSEPETSPTLRWTGKVGDASVFRVWGALSLVRDAKASKLSSRTLRCVFLGFPTNTPPWHFYHSRSRRVFSQDVIFDESGLAPLGVSQVDPSPLVEPLEISSESSGPAEGGDPAADDTAATRRSPRLETPPGFPPRPTSLPPQPVAEDYGAETAGAEPGGAETEGEGSGGAATGGAGSGATAA
ncbi:unnamed protein product [Closterium sp. NIES-54]